MIVAAGVGAVAAPVARADDFAVKVIDYSPASGQFVNDPAFNDPTRALGAPVGGGTINPDNTSLVTLGGFGGSITLAFDHTVLDDPGNPMGLDAIVFGNAFYPSGDPTQRWAEAGLIEISFDANFNGVADDAWYTIPGSSLSAPVMLPLSSDFDGPILFNSGGAGATTESHFGYADLGPTLILGDTDGDNIVDDPNAKPDQFYTTPDDPLTVGVSPGSGGGDAFDIASAIDPATGEPAELVGFDFIRITTAVSSTNGVFGEVSTEIDAVADVRSTSSGACLADVNGDGVLTAEDFSAWLAAFGNGDPAADQNGDGILDPSDFTAWLANFQSGCDTPKNVP
ncbi:MAG TPA: hypothetical protein ENJ00_05485 [Phycisphaerales bacterium]|nr:hypothetical protein [Phycisphaerales bacterium]